MITVREAARRAGRNPETIRRWIREGKLASRKVDAHADPNDDPLEVFGSESCHVEYFR